MVVIADSGHRAQHRPLDTVPVKTESRGRGVLVRMCGVPMHHDEIEIEVAQVERLLKDQLPEIASLPVTRVQSWGTVNAIFRVGTEFAVRLPLRAGDPQVVRSMLEREAEAAAELSESIATPVPRPVHIGQPGHGYPLPWSVQTWISGTTTTPTGTESSVELAGNLVELLRSLRARDTRGRQHHGDGRGGSIPRHDAWVETCLRDNEDRIDVAAMRRLWNQFRLLPREDADVMSHADLIPWNLLVDSGRLVGVLDGGGFSAADPALDLVSAWHLLAQGPRDLMRRELGCSELQWERGRAWAFEQAIGVLWYRESNPKVVQMGETTLRRLLEDA